jgi:hypothetical protein
MNALGREQPCGTLTSTLETMASRSVTLANDR